LPVFRVYVDSNSLHGDRLLTKPRLGKRILDFATEGRCVLHLSPVVIGELSRQELTELKDNHTEMDTRIDRIDRAHGDTSQLRAQLRAFVENAESLIGNRFQKLVAGGGVVIQPWPAYSGEEIVKRELDYRRPFLRKEVGTIGHRDTVIWLGLVELAKSFPDDTIFFITNDDGFKKEKKLHPDLIDELASAGVNVDHVRLYPDFYPLLEFLKTTPVEEDEEAEEDEDATDEDVEEELPDVPDLATWRAAITQALWEYNETLKEITWTRKPSHDGDWYDPDWEIGLPKALEDAELLAIDGPFEVSIGADHVTVDEPVTCTHQITLSLSGFMTKWDWYDLEDEADISLVDGDWNDHYVVVDAAPTIKVTTKVIYDSLTGEASVEDLEAVALALCLGSRKASRSFSRALLALLDLIGVHVDEEQVGSLLPGSLKLSMKVPEVRRDDSFDVLTVELPPGSGVNSWLELGVIGDDRVAEDLGGAPACSTGTANTATGAVVTASQVPCGSRKSTAGGPNWWSSRRTALLSSPGWFLHGRIRRGLTDRLAAYAHFLQVPVCRPAVRHLDPPGERSRWSDGFRAASLGFPSQQRFAAVQKGGSNGLPFQTHNNGRT
jgi:hypothetical protein